MSLNARNLHLASCDTDSDTGHQGDGLGAVPLGLVLQLAGSHLLVTVVEVHCVV